MNSIVREDIKTIIQRLSIWEQFRNKTVLISGANGFLPAYMVETLLELNNIFSGSNTKVIGLVRNLYKAQKRFEKYSEDIHLTLLEHDVCKPIDISTEVNFIIHAASQASAKYYYTDPVGTLNANILGTTHLIQLAYQKKIESFLYFSSAEIYGSVPDNNEPITEQTPGYINPLDVRNCYAESKRMGENICISWAHQFGVNAKIVRPFHTYGPGMDLTDGRVFADFVSNVVKDENILLKSDGSDKRAFCYLADAVQAFFLVLIKGHKAEAYNVGNPAEEYSIENLASILTSLGTNRQLKVERITPLRADKRIPRIIPSIRKIEELGWYPETNIKEGFSRTIESFRIKSEG